LQILAIIGGYFHAPCRFILCSPNDQAVEAGLYIYSFKKPDDNILIKNDRNARF